VYGKKCTEPGQSNSQSCITLETNFLKKTGISINKALAYTGTTVTVPTSGGEVILPGIARVIFPNESFNQDTVVRVFISSNPRIMELHNNEAILHGIAPLIDYQVIVDVGNANSNVPYRPVKIELALSKETTGLSTEDHIYYPVTFEEVGSDEEIPHIEPLIDYTSTSEAGGRAYLSVEIPVGAFVKSPKITNSSFQAIATLMAQKKNQPADNRE
jgi:hypothetical protein